MAHKINLKNLICLSLLLHSLFGLWQTAQAQAFRYSVNSGAQGLDAAALRPSINQDHRYVVFHSQATNIASANDPSAVSDVFLSCQNIELITGNNPTGTQRTTHISRGINSSFADGNSSNAKISPDGRYVVFQSDAANLVLDDTNGVSDIFLYERPLNCNGNCSCTEESGVIARVSRPLDLDANFSGQADGSSFNPQVSKDGCFLAFESDAANLNAKGPSGNTVTDNNSKRDIFLLSNPFGNLSCKKRNCASGDCSLPRSLNIVSALPVYSENGLGIDSEVLSNGDSIAPSISRDGYVSFASNATNLSSQNTGGKSHIYVEAQCSLNGINFAGSKLLLASVASDGTLANDNSSSPSIQQIDGPVMVAFESDATNLVGADTNGKKDVFTHIYQNQGACLVSGQTDRRSIATDGAQADGDSFRPSLSRQVVLFSSDATNLANRVDCNSSRDVFVHAFDGANSCANGDSRPVPRTELAGVSQAGYQPNGLSDFASIAPEYDQSQCPTSNGCGGSFVVFESAAKNIVPANAQSDHNDINGLTDIYGSLAIRNPCTLSSDLKLDEPPQVCPLSRAAQIYLQEFVGADTFFKIDKDISRASNTASKIKSFGSCGKKPDVCYEVTLTPLKKNLRPDPRQDIRKLLTKKNLLTQKKLPPGNYQATFKVRGDIGKSTKSPATKFKVVKF